MATFCDAFGVKHVARHDATRSLEERVPLLSTTK